MRYKQFVATILLSVCQLKIKAEPTDPYYIAGVVEFPSLSTNFAPEDTRDRIQQFRQLIESSDRHPDIIVFPENVLNNRTYSVIVPHPEDNIVPCGSSAPAYDYIITEISCYARSLQIYLLINVVEVENCTTAATTKNCLVYNTNVVFDRGGTVISRYRKYNLIGAEWQYFNYTEKPEDEAIFTTDFNVTFGHFTRMDLLYFRPAQALIEKGITDFLHPSKWQSELPFMTAMQLHQSWAQANNVNLLVAGTNDPLNGRSGTGIYAGQYGALIASMTTDEAKRKLHLSVLPKQSFDINTNNNNNKQTTSPPSTENPQENANVKQFTDRITGIKLGRDNDIDLYTTFPLNDNDGNEIQRQICHNDLCCNFHIKRTSISPPPSLEEGIAYAHYYYRFAAFEGMGTFLNTEPDNVAVCALFACTGDHLYMCARIYPETIIVENRFTFDFIQISANFSQRSKNLILPTSVDGMLKPLPINAFELKEQPQISNISLVSYTLLQPKADLLTFGIYVNYFVDETKYDHHQKDAASSINVFGMTLILLCPMLLSFYSIKLSFS